GDEQPNTVSNHWYHFQDIRPYEFGHDNTLSRYDAPGELHTEDDDQDDYEHFAEDTWVEDTDAAEPQPVDIPVEEVVGNIAEISILDTDEDARSANIVQESPVAETHVNTIKTVDTVDVNNTLKPITEYSLEEVSLWLASVGLSAIAETLWKNDVDGYVLSKLTMEDLAELGLSLGQKRKLVEKIKDAQQDALTLPTPHLTIPSVPLLTTSLNDPPVIEHITNPFDSTTLNLTQQDNESVLNENEDVTLTEESSVTPQVPTAVVENAPVTNNKDRVSTTTIRSRAEIIKKAKKMKKRSRESIGLGTESPPKKNTKN
ncbi:thrB, partial [Acrasis kona]